MLTKENVIGIIRENNEAIKMHGVKKIGIFGSFARSSQHSKSDIDVLVEFQQGKKAFDRYMDLKFFLEKLLHRKVDLVMKGALKPRIRLSVLKDVFYA